MIDLQGMELAAIVAVCILGLWFAERYWLVRVRPRLYFRIGLPLGAALVPIPKPPKGAGQTATVAWQALDDGVVFWVDPSLRGAPGGLHGMVHLRRISDGQVSLDVTWCPPLAAIAGVAWVALLGVLRAEATLAVTVSSVLLVALGLVYRQAALRAAAELRWAFIEAG